MIARFFRWSSLICLALVATSTLHAQEPEKVFIDPVQWTQEVIVSPTAKPGKHEIPVRIRLQVCDLNGCYPGQYLPFTVPVIVEGEAQKLPAQAQKAFDEAIAAWKKDPPKDPAATNPTAKKLKDLISFSAVVKTDNPFGMEHQRDPAEPVVVKVQPGERVTVTIVGKPARGFYTYSIHDKSVSPTIRIGDGDTFTAVGNITEQPEATPYATAKKTLAALTPGAADPAGKGKTAGKPGATEDQDLWGLLVAAFIGGFLMLLTPCVFPMVPITVNFFLKQSEKEHHRPLFLATIYSGTIIALLTLTMLFFGKVVVDLANDPIFNVVLGGVLVFFALSLFGMYEIELPSFLARFTSAREGQGGVVGAFFMALTFTITSFTCTGPFIGIFLGSAAIQQPPFHHLLAAALVYSTTFAAPFFFLALFPTLLRKLPKSGGWLNSVKVTMGFVELGAALKFLAVADYTLFPGNPRLFTFDAVLCSWIALSLATGLYLMGMFRLPHDDPQEHIGVMRMIFSTIFIGLSFYMTPLLFGIRPTGAVGEGLVAFLPPRLDEQSLALGGGGRGKEDMIWHKDYMSAWNEAKKDNKLIFIDFTGVNCPNCRQNEQNVFPRQDVREALKKYVLVKLYCDSVPDKTLSSSAAKELAAKYAEWRDQLSSAAALPTYVVFDPDRKQPYAGEMINGRAVDDRKGTIFDIPDFVKFLREPLAAQKTSGSQVASAR